MSRVFKKLQVGAVGGAVVAAAMANARAMVVKNSVGSLEYSIALRKIICYCCWRGLMLLDPFACDLTHRFCFPLYTAPNHAICLPRYLMHASIRYAWFLKDISILILGGTPSLSEFWLLIFPVSSSYHWLLRSGNAVGGCGIFASCKIPLHADFIIILQGFW